MKTKTMSGKIFALTLAFGLLIAGAALAMDETITGTVDLNDSGKIIIMGDDGDDYLVKGKDLSVMVGKTVKVTGTLAEEGDAKVITVMEMEEVKE